MDAPFHGFLVVVPSRDVFPLSEMAVGLAGLPASSFTDLVDPPDISSSGMLFLFAARFLFSAASSAESPPRGVAARP